MVNIDLRLCLLCATLNALAIDLVSSKYPSSISASYLLFVMVICYYSTPHILLTKSLMLSSSSAAPRGLSMSLRVVRSMFPAYSSICWLQPWLGVSAAAAFQVPSAAEWWASLRSRRFLRALVAFTYSSWITVALSGTYLHEDAHFW
jgi:hypothetical protein